MPDYSMLHTAGGQKTAAVAAGGGTADVVVSTKPGRITKIVTTATGTASLELYDHSSASAGAKLVWKSPAVQTAGDNVVLDIPVSIGVVAKQISGSAAVTVYFTEDAVAGTGDKQIPLAYGGQLTSAHAAGAGGAGQALLGRGRLCRIVVLALGTAVTDFYDNTSAAGKKLFTLKASPAVGSIEDVQALCETGIFVGGAANTSQVLVCYSKDSPGGR